jgi:hypothetical protein
VRKELEKIDEVRSTFTGTFVRGGIKNGWKGRIDKTVLLKNIRNLSGVLMCDHLWFNLTKQFCALSLVEGDVVQFDARVKEYEKGYKGYRDDVDDAPIETDYKLSHPTKIKKINGEARKEG